MRAVKPDIMALYERAARHDAVIPRATRRAYLEEFYRTIDRPGDVKRAFIDNCDNRRGM